MDNENELAQLKETIMFLLEQEKAHADELVALKQQIESVNSFMMDNIVTPSVDAYNQQRFNEFNDKYGERLGKYDDMIKTSLNDPEYSSTKEAWDSLEALPPEERSSVDEDAYVSSVEQGLVGYVDSIKQSFGIPSDEAVEIKDDGEGNVEVKADENGDGVPETEVATEESEATEEAEAPVEESEADTEKSEDEDGEPSQADIDAYLNGDDLKDKE